MAQSDVSPDWRSILGTLPIFVDIFLLCLTLRTIKVVKNCPADRWSQRSFQSQLVFGSVVAFSLSTLLFNGIKVVYDARNLLAPEGMAEDSFIIYNGVLMVCYLFNSYLMLFAMYTRLSILYKSNCHKYLFGIGLVVLIMVLGVIGAAPIFGPSLLVQQLCVVSVLMPIVLCTVILFAASTKRISPSIMSADDTDISRPSVASKPLGPQQRQSFQRNHMNLMLNQINRGGGGRMTKSKTSTMDSDDANANLSANQRSLKRREQDLLRKFVKQQQKTVVVIVLTLALQILMAGIMARYDSLMTNKWTVLITSFVLSLNSGITLRSITSTHRQQHDRPKLCVRTCQWLRTSSRRKKKLDKTRYVKRGDGQMGEGEDGENPSQIELEGIQIHQTGCHQTNKNPKSLLDDEMMDKIPYFDACVFPDTAMSYQSHGDPVSIEMPSFDDSPPPVPSRIIASFRGSIDIVESTLSLSSEGTTFNYEY